jgi:hypothetical protein
MIAQPGAAGSCTIATMSNPPRKPPPNPTVQVSSEKGNALFERAVTALGYDAAAMRWMMVSALNTVGATPASVTPDELGNLLPEVDRRLRQLILADQADEAMGRLYSCLMSWESG